MPLKVIAEDDIGSLVAHLMTTHEVVGARPKDGKYAFGRLAVSR